LVCALRCATRGNAPLASSSTRIDRSRRFVSFLPPSVQRQSAVRPATVFPVSEWTEIGLSRPAHRPSFSRYKFGSRTDRIESPVSSVLPKMSTTTMPSLPSVQRPFLFPFSGGGPELDSNRHRSPHVRPPTKHRPSHLPADDIQTPPTYSPNDQKTLTTYRP
jgi:hypothetical protein